MPDAACTLGACLSVVWSFTKIYRRTDFGIFTQICAYVRQRKKCSMDTKFWDCIVQWSIAALRFLKENPLKNFGLIAIFVKVAFEVTKRAQHCVNMPMRAASRSRAKTILTSFSRDLYSDRPKNNIIIKFSVCVIHVLQWFHSRIQRIQRWKVYLQNYWVEPP